MFSALELIAPFLVFVALIDFRRRARRRVLAPVQLQPEGGLREPTREVAPLESSEPIRPSAPHFGTESCRLPYSILSYPQTTPAAKDTDSAFDKLRRAMEDNHANHFALLEAALTELVRVGRSLEVRMYFLNMLLHIFCSPNRLWFTTTNLCDCSLIQSTPVTCPFRTVLKLVTKCGCEIISPVSEYAAVPPSSLVVPYIVFGARHHSCTRDFALSRVRTMKEVGRQYKKAKNKLKGLVRPPSRQSSLEPTSTPGGVISTASVAKPRTIQQEIVPIKSTAMNSDAHGLVETVHGPPSHSVHATAAYEHVSSDPHLTAIRSIEELRAAMERNDANLLRPLQVAFVGIVNVGRSAEIQCTVERELTALEARLPGFEAAVTALKVDDDAATGNKDLQNLLHAMGVVVLRIWNVFLVSTCRVTSGQLKQPIWDSNEYKSLLELLISLLETFEFDNNVDTIKRLKRVRQLTSRPSKDSTGCCALASIVNSNSNANYIAGDGYVSNNNWAINIIRSVKEQENAIRTIDRLLGQRFVSEAADDTQPAASGCMTGTRTRVLSKFVRWAIGDAKRIYWLTGMAGTGKSSIAVTLCRMLREESGVLFGGGFFCSRSSGSITRMDVRRVLPTLARLMAENSPEFATALVVELGKADRVACKPVRDQIGPLLRQPIFALSQSSRPIVFVIDGLDELNDENELEELLELIADFKSQVLVKFILTSRPAMHIRRTPISNPEHNTILKLHSIDQGEVKQDIHQYINGTLARAVNGSAWYTDADVDALVELSSCLFIFASTALTYILDSDHDYDRSERLHEVTSAINEDTAATARLDTIYELVVTGASRPINIGSRELERLKSIIACILSARSLLTVEALAALLKLQPGILRSSLRHLHAVVNLPEADNLPGLHALHASFGDYLFYRAPEHIRIPRLLGHEMLAHGCLDLMDSHLHFNVSKCTSSYNPNSIIKPDSVALSLEYACLHWAHHVVFFKAGEDPIFNITAFDVEINQKFRPKFLFWLEVLSVLDKVGLASGLLLTARSSVEDPILLQFLRDANSFVASSREAIERSAPHIYLSALPFAAKTSLVYQDFSLRCTGLISVETFGIGQHGGSVFMTLTGHGGPILSVAYSPDGLLLVSGSDDGTVRVWDTLAGDEVLSPLRSGDGGVVSVDFARNNKWIAAGTESGAVCIWNVAQGQTSLQRLIGHNKCVNSVAYSPDSSQLASASNDKTICLWNAETGKQLIVLNGHTNSVYGVTFSPTGENLASISSDGTIRVWHRITGQAAREPIVNGGCYSIDYSPDGEMIAGGLFNSVKIWRLQTGEMIAELQGAGMVRSIRFLPGGRSLVATHGQHVRVWTLQSESTDASWIDLRGHSNSVYSAAFSPDGLYIASASEDGTIRIWSAVTGQPAVQPLPAHESHITSVAVSRDGTFIVSGSWDESVRVWNACTGDEQVPPLCGHKGWIMSVAVSPDGRLIASGSWDRTVRLWDAQSGAAVGEPMRGHTDNIRAVSFSHDGGWLASASGDGTLRMWDIATLQTLAVSTLRCHDIALTVAFAPNGSLIVAGGERGCIYLWRIDTSELVQTPCRLNTRILSVAFSPDTTHIVSGGTDNAARIWELSTDSSVLFLQGHTGSVCSVAWSFDGRFIGTGSEDCTVRLWDAVTGAMLATLHGHTEEINSVAFTFDGKFIVSGSHETMIRKWDVDAACKPALERVHDSVGALASVASNNGWLVGSSSQLLLWVPFEYREYLQAVYCTLLIDRSRVVIRAGDSGLHAGPDWTACWTD